MMRRTSATMLAEAPTQVLAGALTEAEVHAADVRADVELRKADAECLITWNYTPRSDVDPRDAWEAAGVCQRALNRTGRPFRPNGQLRRLAGDYARTHEFRLPFDHMRAGLVRDEEGDGRVVVEAVYRSPRDLPRAQASLFFEVAVGNPPPPEQLVPADLSRSTVLFAETYASSHRGAMAYSLSPETL